MTGARLDVELVGRGLARSRAHAAELIKADRVLIDGRPARKPATPTPPGADLVVRPDPSTGAGTDGDEWASRAAHKLLGALQAFRDVEISGRRCLDAGACTGGFTDVLLRRGAGTVVAVDVGHDQLLPRLAADPRVRNYEGLNVRDLTPGAIGGPAQLTVADLSFISLRLVLPALSACTTADGTMLLMVKPQFEVGRQRLGAGGVVRDPQLRAGAVVDVVKAAAESGWTLRAVAPSPLPGPSGNVEYFVRLQHRPARTDAAEPGPASGIDTDLPCWTKLIDAAVEAGPR